MRRFVAPRAVPVGAVQALYALEQQAVWLAFNPQHAFIAQQLLGGFQQQIFHYPRHVADVHRVIQFDDDRGDIVLLVGDKVEARFGADHVLFQHKTVGVKKQREVDIAMRDGVNRGTGVDARQALTQFLAFTCDVGFGQQDAVSIADLRLGDGKLVHLLVGMHRVNQRNYAVQQVAFANHFMGEKGLDNRAGVGHAGALDHQTVKIDGAFVEVVEQV